MTEVDQVVVMVGVVESQAEETDVGGGVGSWMESKAEETAWGMLGGPGRLGWVLVTGSCG